MCAVPCGDEGFARRAYPQGPSENRYHDAVGPTSQPVFRTGSKSNPPATKH